MGNDIFSILYGKRHYTHTKLEGLEDVLPQFNSKSIILYSGRKLHGGGGRKKSRRSYDRAKLAKRRLPFYYD